jgi:hypothetical protein
VKTSSIIAGLTTFVLVILLSVLAGFMQMVTMNGATTGQGFNAAAVLAVCQSLILLVCVVLARWLTNWLMTKFNWNGFLAILIAVFSAVVLGGGVSLISIFVGILAAGIR